MDVKGQRNICVCVSKDIYQFLKWSLAQFSKEMNVITIEDPDHIMDITASKKADILIVDYSALKGHAGEDLHKIKEANPHLNILLIIPSAINREEALEIIKGRLVKGMIVLPFSAEVICSYMGKLASLARTCSSL